MPGDVQLREIGVRLPQFRGTEEATAEFGSFLMSSNSTVPTANEEGVDARVVMREGASNTARGWRSLRGIAPAHLHNVFLPEVAAEGLSPASNIYDVEANVIRSKSKSITCPRDGRLGAAYVDCIPNVQAGQSSVMLSYAWSYTIGDIVDTLREFCRTSGHDTESTFFWICVFCINQQ